MFSLVDNSVVDSYIAQHLCNVDEFVCSTAQMQVPDLIVGPRKWAANQITAFPSAGDLSCHCFVTDCYC